MKKAKRKGDSEKAAADVGLVTQRTNGFSEYMFYSLSPDSVTVIANDASGPIKHLLFENTYLNLFPIKIELIQREPGQKYLIPPDHLVNEATFKTSLHPHYYAKIPGKLLENYEGNETQIATLISEAKRHYNEIEHDNLAYICVADYGPYYDLDNYCLGENPVSGNYTAGNLIAACGLKLKSKSNANNLSDIPLFFLVLSKEIRESLFNNELQKSSKLYRELTLAFVRTRLQYEKEILNSPKTQEALSRIYRLHGVRYVSGDPEALICFATQLYPLLQAMKKISSSISFRDYLCMENWRGRVQFVDGRILDNKRILFPNTETAKQTSENGAPDDAGGKFRGRKYLKGLYGARAQRHFDDFSMRVGSAIVKVSAEEIYALFIYELKKYSPRGPFPEYETWKKWIS